MIPIKMLKKGLIPGLILGIILLGGVAVNAEKKHGNDESAASGKAMLKLTTDPDGYITGWLVAGPFPNGGLWSNSVREETDYLAKYGGEEGIKPEEGMKIRYFDGTVKKEFSYNWQVYLRGDYGLAVPLAYPYVCDRPAGIVKESNFVDFYGLYGDTKNDISYSTAYAFCYLEGKEDGEEIVLKPFFRCGVPGGSIMGFVRDPNHMARVWVNGKLVYDLEGRKLDEAEKITLKLRRGLNSCLIKVRREFDVDDAWGFNLRLEGRDGEPLTGRKVYLPAKWGPEKVREKSFVIYSSPLISRDDKGNLIQRLTVEFRPFPGLDSRVALKVGGKEFQLNLAESLRHELELPELQRPTAVELAYTREGRKEKAVRSLTPPKHWTIYLLPSAHNDLSWDFVPSEKIDIESGWIDEAVALYEQTVKEGYPRELQYKWNIESACFLERYLDTQPKEKVAKVIRLMKEGIIGVNAFYCTTKSSALAGEEWVRSMAFTGALERRYGVKVEAAQHTDTTYWTWGAIPAMAGSGVKYFGFAGGDDRGVPNTWRGRVFWHEGPDRSRVLVWAERYHYGTPGVFWHSAPVSETANLEPHILNMIQGLERRGYPYDIAKFFAGSDDSRPNITCVRRAKEWNDKYAYPKIVIGTFSEPFKVMEKRFGDKLPVYRGELNELMTCSLYEEGQHRMNQQNVLAAETLSSLSALLDRHYPYPADKLNQVWRQILFWDNHAQRNNSPLARPFPLKNWKERYGLDVTEEWVKQEWQKALDEEIGWVTRSSQTLSALIEEAVTAVGSRIKTEKEKKIIVFNPQGWPQTDIVKIKSPSGDFRIRDELTKKSAGWQRLSSGEIIFLAEDVPPVGYKVYEVIPGQKEGKSADEITFTGNKFENRFYALTLSPDTGEITSLRDKELKKELIDPKDYKFAENVIWEQHLPVKTHEEGFQRESKTRGAEIVLLEKGPLLAKVLLKTQLTSGQKIEKEITLFRDIKRIDLENRIRMTRREMGQMWHCFPFAVPRGTFRVETANGVVDPAKDFLPASVNRWVSYENWVDISNDDYGITVLAPNSFMVETGRSTIGHFPEAPFRWYYPKPMDNTTIYFRTNTDEWTNTEKLFAREEVYTHKYRITTHKGRVVNSQAARFAYGYYPSLRVMLIEQDQEGDITCPSSLSLCKVEPVNVRARVIKEAYDNNGYIIRLQELDGKETRVKLTFPLFSSFKASLTDLQEYDKNPIKVNGDEITIPINGYGLQTIRIYDMKIR